MKTITQIGAQIKDKQYSLIDIGIAADHFCLQAVEEGLGTCMLGWYNEKPIKKILGIPRNRRIGLLITLGYPPEDYRVREKIRKGREEKIRFNSYK
jgi:nitroreductase